uniref:Ig-like domain-containing protein n=1 Tax=Crocodylus porosus TaxID=8502 RepID=A0A7M4DXQ3_CROPO
MGLCLVWCMAVCLLGVRHSDGRIIQKQSLVLENGTRAQLDCEQTDGHSRMFWYRQVQKQELVLLVYSLAQNNVENSISTKEVTASRPETSLFHLTIPSVNVQDSAVYFCATSLDTVTQKHLFPLQKPLFCSPRHRKLGANCCCTEAKHISLSTA